MLREKKNFFGRLSEKIQDVLLMRVEIDEEMMDELEEAIIQADVSVETTIKIIDKLREDIKKQDLWSADMVKNRLAEIIEELLDKKEKHEMTTDYPIVVLFVGVNGSGKTTSIAKLASKYKEEGKTVLLAAADTFRAAAAEQLSTWADRIGIDVIKHQPGADPSAVIFDAVKASKARNIDVLLCDTAGRLQNKKNLMTELEKMHKVIKKEYPETSIETLLVIDAATGKNAVSQAKEFGEIAEITGIVLTKLDGTAKGGIILTIADIFDLPVKYVGIGERVEDLVPFNAKEFSSLLFS